MSKLLERIADIENLTASYAGLDAKKKPGPDGMSKDAFGVDLEQHLTQIREQLLHGHYMPGSVLRVLKLKPDGRERPIAMANVRDKIVHRAVLTILAPLIEPSFLSWSCCRSGLGAEYAADLTYNALVLSPSEIIVLDVQDCYGNLNLGMIEALLEHHGVDEDVRLLVDRLLSPMVVDASGDEISRKRTGVGVEQGLPLSLFVANLVLHHVLDTFIEELRDVHDMAACRYLDDVAVSTKFVAAPAELLATIRERMDEAGLPLHPKKTRIVPFGDTRVTNLGFGERAPESFDFVGYTFTHGRLPAGGWAPFRTKIGDGIDAGADAA